MQIWTKDIPRRSIKWVLICERLFYYCARIGGCIGVHQFY